VLSSAALQLRQRRWPYKEKEAAATDLVRS